MKLSKTDISIWLISGFAITGLTLLFMGVMNAPASPYRPIDIPESQVQFISQDEPEEIVTQPKKDPALVIFNADSTK
jgi:hypothetical protein